MRTQLSDTTVSIRPFGSQDLSPLYQAARESLAEMMPWMRWCESDFSLADCGSWLHYAASAWDKGEAYNFAIIEPGNGQLVGTNWLSHVNVKHRFANLGYWVRTSCVGRGLATAAGRLIARFGFEELGLNRLEIMVALGNRASERVAEKLGARREGILRQRLQLEGKAKDAVLFGLLAESLKTSTCSRPQLAPPAVNERQ